MEDRGVGSPFGTVPLPRAEPHPGPRGALQGEGQGPQQAPGTPLRSLAFQTAVSVTRWLSVSSCLDPASLPLPLPLALPPLGLNLSGEEGRYSLGPSHLHTATRVQNLASGVVLASSSCFTATGSGRQVSSASRVSFRAALSFRPHCPGYAPLSFA